MNKVNNDISFELEDEINETSQKIIMTDFDIEINRNDLLKTLSHINGVVEKRNIISILGNVKLETFDNILHLTATDMDIAITESVSALVKKEGSITVPAQMLYDIIRKLGDKSNISLTLDSKTNKLNIIADNCDFTLPALASDTFPNIEFNDVITQFTVTSSDLKNLISKTKFAISTEETRYNLNGIYFHHSSIQNENYLIAAATDGHRLSQIKILLPENLSEMPGVILPRKAAIELNKLLDETKNIIKLEISNTKMKFTLTNITFITKLIDANFPDYQNFIPKQNNKKLTINRENFSKAVDRVSTLSIEKFSAVKLKLSSNRIDLTVNNDQYGIAHEMLLVNYQEEALDIAFNARYILEIMSVMEGDEISLAFSDAYSPMIIKELSNDLGIYIIMPMRI